MEITALQQMWLNSCGGRDINDVQVVKGKACVPMSNKGDISFVEIPSDNYIKKAYKIISRARAKYVINTTSMLVLRMRQKTP